MRVAQGQRQKGASGFFEAAYKTGHSPLTSPATPRSSGQMAMTVAFRIPNYNFKICKDIKVGYLREKRIDNIWSYFFEEHYRKRAAEKLVIFQSWTESREALHTHTHTLCHQVLNLQEN